MTGRMIVTEKRATAKQTNRHASQERSAMAVMDYRTQDGLADYGFSIEFQPERGWRVYIIFLPHHQVHDKGVELPYQSIDHHGRRYVNWSAKLDTLGDAKTVAALWAELVQHYQPTPKLLRQRRTDAA